MTSFEDELNALRILYSTLQPFTRERRDSMITQVQSALNREGQKVRPVAAKDYLYQTPSERAAAIKEIVVTEPK